MGLSLLVAGKVLLGELCGAGVCVCVACCLSHYRPLITHSCRHLRLLLLASARWVGGWVGARASERAVAGGSSPPPSNPGWLSGGAATRARRTGSAPDCCRWKKRARPRPTAAAAAEEKRNFQMKGRDFICPLIKCRWLPASQIKVALASLCDLLCWHTALWSREIYFVALVPLFVVRVWRQINCND